MNRNASTGINSAMMMNGGMYMMCVMCMGRYTPVWRS